MRIAVAMLAAGVAAGCAQIEAGSAMMGGMLRVEAHPQHADSVRIVHLAQSGDAGMIDNILPAECLAAPRIKEGRVRTGRGGEFVTLRVICPAARVR